MLKYCNFVDKETGRVNVAIGNNIEYYQSIGMIERDVEQSDVDNYWYITEKCPHLTPEEKEEKEHERIQTLYMTRSDFFDGLIKAFGIDEDDLLPVLQQLLNTLPVQEVQKKIAINNYKNALNFYRKHDLFTLLSGVTIPVTEELSITIEADQFDRFFDETDKKNPDAYKELLPKEVEE